MPHRKTALITGGSTGIGFAVAGLLAKEGHRIAIFDIDEDRLAHAATELSPLTETLTRRVDLRRAKDVAEAVRSIEEDAGGAGAIDILVNNVGGSTLRVPAAEMADETFDDIVKLNLYSVFYATRAVSGGMMRRRWGRIVNVASVAGRTNALSTNSNAAYIAAKAGVIGFTRQCAAELAPHGIAVNAVAFGIVETDRVKAGWQSRSAEERARIIDRIPAGRFGHPREAAGAIAYLCGDAAGYTIGTVIDVNGGLYM